MMMPNNKLPKVAINGFFICTSKKYGTTIAVAPIKETANALYCCEVATKTVKEEDDGNYLHATKAPDNFFRKGCTGSAHVYRVPKKEYPREHTFKIDFWR